MVASNREPQSGKNSSATLLTSVKVETHTESIEVVTAYYHFYCNPFYVSEEIL